MMMLVAILRQLRSRLVRTILTTGGIAIGILALVVVGSLAERLSLIVTRSLALNNGAVFAFPTSRDALDDARIGVMRADVRRIAAMPGVRAVVPEIVLPYRFGPGGRDRFGPPALVFGFPDEARGLADRAITIDQGRNLRTGDDRVAVVGADFAASERVAVGSVIAIYGNSFEVVGRVGKSFTVFDAAVVVPYGAAQQLLQQTIGPDRTTLPKNVPASALMVLVKPGSDAGLVARSITVLTSLRAQDPAAAAAQVRTTTRVFDTIVFGSALIALVVGALSIVNTMTIAVAERTREIGIRKAIGAGDRDIFLEFLIEAAAIGAIGGIVGIAAGAAIAALVDANNAAAGNLEVFALTPRVTIGSFAFAVVLSCVAGLIPAIRAARLLPTEALRRVG